MGFTSYCLSLFLYIMSSYLKRYSVLHELNTLDAGRSRSTNLGRDAHILIIAWDIIITLCFSINCSTVICSPTVEFAILREATSETYGPGSIFHYINLPTTSSFGRRLFLQSLLFNLYNKNTKNIYLIISIRSHLCK